MSKSVYWCPHCGIPVIENKICPLCKTEGEVVSTKEKIPYKDTKALIKKKLIKVLNK